MESGSPTLRCHQDIARIYWTLPPRHWYVSLCRDVLCIIWIYWRSDSTHGGGRQTLDQGTKAEQGRWISTTPQALWTVHAGIQPYYNNSTTPTMRATTLPATQQQYWSTTESQQKQGQSLMIKQRVWYFFRILDIPTSPILSLSGLTESPTTSIQEKMATMVASQTPYKSQHWPWNSVRWKRRPL